MPDPFTRQRRLSEVGDAGQARLQAGRALVPDGSDAALATLYLERAGVGSVLREPGPPSVTFAHHAAFRHAESQRVGSGAWRALRELLRLLEHAPTC